MEKGLHTQKTVTQFSVLLQAGVSKLKPITRAMVFFLKDMTGRFNLKVFSEHFKNTFSIYKLIF